MEENNVEFNYFYILFKNKINRVLLEKQQEYLSENENSIDFYSGLFNNTKDKIEIYNMVLYDICVKYLSLSNSKIQVLSTDVFEIIKEILLLDEKNKYSKSFYMSLQFIYQEYFEALKIGRPLLMSHNDEENEKYLMLVFDSNHNLLDVDSKNLSFIEQNLILNEIIMMEVKNSLYVNKNVKIRVRTDL